jgi:hypothetical protein
VVSLEEDKDEIDCDLFTTERKKEKKNEDWLWLRRICLDVLF